MGLFSFLFRKSAERVFLEDEVFGHLEQKSFGENDSECYFHTYNLVFAPTGHEIECEIRCSGVIGSNTPTAAQQIFYQHVERNYDRLTEALTVVLKDELRDWKPPFQFHDFSEEFRLVYLSIPVVDSVSVEWDWTFELVRASMYSLSVVMHNDEPCPGIGISC